MTPHGITGLERVKQIEEHPNHDIFKPVTVVALKIANP
jgi:hypothetical protein